MSIDLPPNVGPTRDQAILQRVREGRYDLILWAPILSTYNEHKAEFQVFADALKMDGVRINVTAEVQQQVADLLDCTLLTPKLADLIWDQREVTLTPFPRGNTNGMSTTQAMVDHSKKIDDALAKLGNPSGLISTVGKHWLIDNDLLAKPGKAENYGWHFSGSSYQGIKGEANATLMKDANGMFIRLIQGRGWQHDMHHADYSQTCVLVNRACVVDDQIVDILDVLQNPELAGLASHQGVMKVLRQPGVPDYTKTLTTPVA